MGALNEYTTDELQNMLPSIKSPSTRETIEAIIERRTQH